MSHTVQEVEAIPLGEQYQSIKSMRAAQTSHRPHPIITSHPSLTEMDRDRPTPNQIDTKPGLSALGDELLLQDPEENFSPIPPLLGCKNGST